MNSSASGGDEVRRFTVEDRPVRGHFVRIGGAWRALREHRDYPAPVRELLGQAVSASVLLAATLKFRGTLTLQLQGDGCARMLISQCTHDFRVRALVRIGDGASLDTAAHRSPKGEGGLTPELFRVLVGQRGRLVVTIEAAERDVRYQGIVPLVGDSFSHCLEGYFASSEQLPTRVRLVADDAHAAGLLIQQLPGRAESEHSVEAQSAWYDAERGIGTVDRHELLGSPVERVLTRNFGRRDLRLYSGAPVRFECRCDPERVAGLLRALGEDEVRDVLREQGAVTVTCDFCNRPYRFDAVDVEGLFAAGAVPGAPPSLQ
jgi:molecular chaperone Hsp33